MSNSPSAFSSLFPRLIATHSSALNPGGYLELQEYCLPAKCDDPEGSARSKHVSWTSHVVSAGARVGLSMSAPLEFHSMLKAVGYVDIHVKWLNWPCGPWAKGEKNKVIGRWLHSNLHDGVATSAAMFTRALGWSHEEFQVFQAEIRNEMNAMTPHVYYNV